MAYREGQRYYSETEPELGLGLILKSEDKRLQIEFPLAQETRTYGIATAPLKRFSLEVGDIFKTVDGKEFKLEKLLEQNEIYFYQAGEEVIPEMALHAQIDLNGPLERITIKSFDDTSFFDLRYQSYLNKRHYEAFTYKGFLGPKVRLIPHQIYVASQILEMERPKAMLCDEVGLGKTIEACLVINSLLQKEIIQSCLFIVPDSLVNQWFIELYTKFNISSQYIHESESNAELSQARFLILSSKMFKHDERVREKVTQKHWEALVIDESHQFNFNQDSPDIDALKKLNEESLSTLLLSATPEILGHKNLFHQLSYLDKNKYDNFEDFETKRQKSKELSVYIKQENILSKKEELKQFFTIEELNLFKTDQACKQALIDRFGTGRNYFRNSRVNLERYSRLFNDRVLNAYPMNIKPPIKDSVVLEEKFLHILKLLETKGHEKILVICHSRKAVLFIQRKLQEVSNEKMAVFHSEQSLLERDRQAAFFADEEGAKILITTEIGSEGRNFEFAGHLVLFDLPILPDQLEQRIGRLDRIGQLNDIQIHIPYALKTFEEIIFTWYDKVLNAFESSPKGANTFYEKHQNELKELMASEFDQDLFNNKINNWSKEYQNFKKEIEEGRDIIVEAHSYHDENARKIIKEIEDFQQQSGPLAYLEYAFDKIGIKLEELGRELYYIAPTDNMLIPSFPGLNAEGFSGSFDRESSIKYPQIHFLSWEHPIVKNTSELFLNNALGNAAIIQQESIKDIFFEFIICLSCTNKDKHKAQKFLPFTPIRVLLNSKLEDVTKKLPKKYLDEIGTQLPQQETSSLEQFPKEIYKKSLTTALNLAKQRTASYIAKAISNSEEYFLHEEQRINGLHIGHSDKERLRLKNSKNKQDIFTSIKSSSLVFDAFRLILPKN